MRSDEIETFAEALRTAAKAFNAAVEGYEDRVDLNAYTLADVLEDPDKIKAHIVRCESRRDAQSSGLSKLTEEEKKALGLLPRNLNMFAIRGDNDS